MNGICIWLFAASLLAGSPASSEPIKFDYRVVDESAGSHGVDVKAVANVDGDDDEDLMMATKNGEVIIDEYSDLAKPLLPTREVMRHTLAFGPRGSRLPLSINYLTRVNQ